MLRHWSLICQLTSEDIKQHDLPTTNNSTKAYNRRRHQSESVARHYNVPARAVATKTRIIFIIIRILPDIDYASTAVTGLGFVPNRSLDWFSQEAICNVFWKVYRFSFLLQWAKLNPVKSGAGLRRCYLPASAPGINAFIYLLFHIKLYVD